MIKKYRATRGAIKMLVWIILLILQLNKKSGETASGQLYGKRTGRQVANPSALIAVPEK
jgi:hypothetical protein